MRTIIIFFLLFTFSTNLFANNKKTNFGALAGINFSRLNGGHVEQINRIDQLTSKFGYNFGLFFRYNININSSLNIELLYLKKGSLWIRPFYIPYIWPKIWDGDIVWYSINYIELPIQYEYHLFKRNNGSELLNLLAGTFFSSVTKASDLWGFELAPSKDIPSDPLYKNINHFDLGLTFGLKYFISNRIFIKINYDFSLVNIHKNGIKRAPADFPDKKNLKMRSLLLYLGINIF
ncbi:MAG: PorT family protein [Calditrichaeota bacterium]|nr:PorT family protein [Calditrichota bacterium]